MEAAAVALEADPASDEVPAAASRLLSEGVGDEADEGDEIEDSESEVGWREAVAYKRLYRFRPGPWLQFQLPDDLLADLTNYPLAIRSQILTCLLEALTERGLSDASDDGPLPDDLTTEKKTTTREPSAADESALVQQTRQSLNNAWELDETTTEALRAVAPDKIVPRFLWYQRELERLYDADFVRETLQMRTDPTFVGVPSVQEAFMPDVALPTPEVPNEPLEMGALPTLEGSEEPMSQGSVGASVTPPAVDFSALKSPVIFRKKKKKVIAITHMAPGTMPLPTEGFKENKKQGVERTDALSMTIRDMQFRLSRHGTVADPRSYLGKGDMSYDKDDPFFDDEELMLEIGLTKEDLNARLSDASGEEDEGGMGDSDESEDEFGMDRLGQIYEGTEDFFFVDNFSEESDNEDEAEAAPAEGAARSRKGFPPRVIATFPFAKPAVCPLVFNPRAWHKVRSSLSPVAVAFLCTLECVVPSKRLPFLQRTIFETAELAEVDASTDPPRVRLNAEGVRVVTEFLGQVYRICFASFLHILLPQHPPHCLPALPLQRHSRVALSRLEQLNDNSASTTCHGFVDYEPDTVEVLDEVSRNLLTPYSPSVTQFREWWWTAVAEHTFRIFAAREDSTVNELDDFFERHKEDMSVSQLNERIRGWSSRAKICAKMRAQLQSSKRGSVTSEVSTPAKNSGENNSESQESCAETAENQSTLQDLRQAEAEMEADDEIFAPFDELSSAVIQFAIAFNLRRQIFRDILEANQLFLLKILYPALHGSSSASSSLPLSSDSSAVGKTAAASAVSNSKPVEVGASEDQAAPAGHSVASSEQLPSEAGGVTTVGRASDGSGEEGAMIPAISSFEMEGLLQTSDQERQKLEKALAASWASRLVQLLEDSSLAKSGTALRSTAAWLESRMRRYRKQVKVPNLYEKRKPKPPRERQFPWLLPLKDNQTLLTVSKRRRGDRSSETGSIEGTGTPLPPGKRRRNDLLPQQSIVTRLLQKHTLPRILSVLQMSPKTLPTTLYCSVTMPAGDSAEEKTVSEVETRDFEFSLQSVESWDRQRVVMRARDEDPGAEEARSFDSLTDAVTYLKDRTGGTLLASGAVVHEAYDEFKLHVGAWQVFSIGVGEASVGTAEHAHPASERPADRMSLLDFLCLHFWIQHLESAEERACLSLSAVFVQSNVMEKGQIPAEHRLSLPQGMAAAILRSRHDMMQPAPLIAGVSASQMPPDRIRAGQVALLARKQASLASLFRFRHHLPPWSNSFARTAF